MTPVAKAALARLTDWVRLPSVSTDPAYAEGMEAARAFAEAWIAELGFTGLRRLADEGSGHPALYAEWLGAPGRPTLLVYGHYDVQPPDPLEKWTTPPFVPSVRDGRLYGRGVSDDKGPVAVALAALGALMAMGGLPVNVKLLLEGEEECGSPSLPGILRRHRDLLTADAVLSADGARWRPDLVTVNVGSRGNGALEITLRTAAKDLHSGRFGGLVPNAGQALAQLLATLHDREGRIAVAGFCDELEAPDPATLAAIPFDATVQAAAVGAEPFGDPDRHPLERLWYRPTIEINGLWGGYTGAGAKTVIPAEAHAKLTCRLAPGQDPAAARAALEAHLHAQCPPGATLTLHGRHGWTGAVSVPGDHPLLRAVEATLAARTGTAPLRVRIGATLPLAEIVKDALGLDTVMFSYSTADEDFHAPDEFFRVASLEDGIAAWTDLLRRLGAERAADWAPWRR